MWVATKLGAGTSQPYSINFFRGASAAAGTSDAIISAAHTMREYIGPLLLCKPNGALLFGGEEARSSWGSAWRQAAGSRASQNGVVGMRSSAELLAPRVWVALSIRGIDAGARSQPAGSMKTSMRGGATGCCAAFAAGASGATGFARRPGTRRLRAMARS